MVGLDEHLAEDVEEHVNDYRVACEFVLAAVADSCGLYLVDVLVVHSHEAEALAGCQLADAEFLRYGVMHRNTFLCGPKVLNANYSVKGRENIFFAGQITGVEGYVESASSGMVAGINAARKIKGEESVSFPPSCCTGALIKYITDRENKKFQPMNANFGIVNPLGYRVKGGKAAKNEKFSVKSTCQRVKIDI